MPKSTSTTRTKKSGGSRKATTPVSSRHSDNEPPADSVSEVESDEEKKAEIAAMKMQVAAMEKASREETQGEWKTSKAQVQQF